MKRTIPWVLALAATSVAGCSSVPTFDERVRPLEPICSDEGSPGPCPGEQLCLSGRCFEACTGDAECAARETCEDGVCVGSGRGIDGGMFDAGIPSEPCEGLCVEPEVCDVRTNQCVSCFDGTQCPTIELPICDYAQGACIAAHGGEACRPCNDSADCADGSTCMLRPDFTERVCLTPCANADDCGPGFICNTADGVCEPPLGGCTQLRRSLDRITCETDQACVARQESAESGTCSAATCLAACLESVGCPEGWSCDGTHCQPAAIMPAM